MRILLSLSVILGIVILFLLWTVFQKNYAVSIETKDPTKATDIQKKDTITIITTPLAFKNTGTTGEMYAIPKSTVLVRNTLQLKTAFSIDTRASQSASGILFTNELNNRSMPEKDKASLFLFYYKPDSTWTLRSMVNGKKTYTILKNEKSDGNVSGVFLIEIAKKGTSISITASSKKTTITLPSSLYATTNSMSAAVILEPKDQLTIQRLTYTQK